MTWNSRRLVFFVAILGGLNGCMVGPNFHSPAAPNTSSYTSQKLPANTVSTPVSGGASQHFNTTKKVSADWWTLFHSTKINQLIAQGIANSPNLAAAEAAIRQAHENLMADIGSTLLPTVDANLSTIRQRTTLNSIGVGSGASLYNTVNASVDVSYNFDIFGGSRREVESLRAAVDYQRYQWEAAYLTLTSNIVTTAISIASVQKQIEATQHMIELEAGLLKITQEQARLGGVAGLNVVSQATELAQLQATLPPLEKSLATYQDSLAVLVGALPSELSFLTLDLDALKLPSELPLSLPSSLVRQRPDIQASEALLHEASAQIGVATANLFPQLSLTASQGGSNSSFGPLFSSSSGVWSAGLNLTQPIFHGGALQSQRKAAIAAYDQAFAEYRQTVLVAFQNVADTLYAIQIDARLLKADEIAENAARKTYLITKDQYKLGGVSYLALLIAEEDYQKTRINRIQAQAARYADTAALFQSLGGGWWNRTCQEVCEKRGTSK